MRHITFFLLLCIGASCIEPTQPKFQTEEPFYLVEGDIADREGLSEVRIRRSNFGSVQLRFDAVPDVVVTAEEGGGAQVQWEEAGDDSGIYRPPSDFRARSGESWQLRVAFADGTTAVSVPETVPLTTTSGTTATGRRY